jgi:hypothetical protein
VFFFLLSLENLTFKRLLKKIPLAGQDRKLSAERMRVKKTVAGGSACGPGASSPPAEAQPRAFARGRPAMHHVRGFTAGLHAPATAGFESSNRGLC